MDSWVLFHISIRQVFGSIHLQSSDLCKRWHLHCQSFQHIFRQCFWRENLQAQFIVLLWRLQNYCWRSAIWSRPMVWSTCCAGLGSYGQLSSLHLNCTAVPVRLQWYRDWERLHHALRGEHPLTLFRHVIQGRHGWQFHMRQASWLCYHRKYLCNTVCFVHIIVGCKYISTCNYCDPSL